LIFDKFYLHSFLVIIMSSITSFAVQLLPLLLCLSPSLAHPGEHHDHAEVVEALAKRDAHGANIQRALAACAAKSEYRELKARGETRRFEKAQALRAARGLDLNSTADEWTILSHKLIDNRTVQDQA
jgi:hypothetical protein